MNHFELRAIRHEMKYSLADVGVLIGIPKTTLQRYEDGSAKIPLHVEEKINAARAKNKVDMASLRASIEARAAKDFPAGIMSEVE